MNLDRCGAAMAAVVVGAGFIGWAAPASAACYQVLAPNRWQYITQCTNSGGGGGGGADYSAAIGVVGAGIEAAPVVIDILGGVLGTGADLLSGVASTGGSIVSGVASTGGDIVSGAAETTGNMVNSGVSSESGASSDSNGRSGLRDIIRGNLGMAAPNSSEDNEPSKASDCRGMRGLLTPHAANEAWIVDQMARSGCRPNGTKMSLRERTKRALEQKAREEEFQNPFAFLTGGRTQPSAPDRKTPKSRSTITGRSSGGDSGGGLVRSAQ
jgi:hypothetical protein